MTGHTATLHTAPLHTAPLRARRTADLTGVCPAWPGWPRRDWLLPRRSPTPPPRPGEPAGDGRGRAGWAVRLDWPDGTHTVHGFTRSQPRARRRLRGLARFWASGPARPRAYRLVAMDRDCWRAHASLRVCDRQGCP